MVAGKGGVAGGVAGRGEATKKEGGVGGGFELFIDEKRGQGDAASTGSSSSKTSSRQSSARTFVRRTRY